MAALFGNFLFVSNIGNQAALPSVLQEAMGKGSLNTGLYHLPLRGWPASVVGTALLEGTPGKMSGNLGQGHLEY